MLSRVAESIYWMNRQLERAENIARAAETTLDLALDREFPRAMHFCLIKAEESLLAVTGGTKGTYSTPAEQRLGRLRAELNYAHNDELLAAPGGLHAFIDLFQLRLNRASDAIHDTFFALRPVGKTSETIT